VLFDSSTEEIRTEITDLEYVMVDYYVEAADV